MNIEQFEDEFPEFYVDYGFKMNPTPSPAYPELLAEEKYYATIEKAMAENTPDSYFIKLTNENS
ncbi:hypothetical protein CAL7716_100360 (plasmid) [Calothrix sp. PCC 7716]|nr:hypothetical protein CAL7716_100360 [Calothrix sp. PCC 7716]